MSELFGASFSIEIKPESDGLFIPIPEDLGPASWPQRCIYRVPQSLRRVNPSAYTPILVSIGPLHHGDPRFQAMETQKLRYLQDFCNRTGKTSSELAVKVKENEETIRRCYEEASKLCSKKFIRMILLDSVFIIELFLKKHYKNKEDYILNKPLMENNIKRDLMILENQLPWFILEDLYNYSFPIKDPSSFVKLSFSFMDLNLHYRKNTAIMECHQAEAVQQEGSILHFVYLFRKAMTSDLRSQERSQSSVSKLYNATQLHEAGVKFMLSSRETPHLEMTFKAGVLSMAEVVVSDLTECKYRNVMAFEQCHLPYHSYFCDFIIFLDYLIDSENDVDLLVQSGVIVNKLGESRAVSRMVNRLCKEIASTGSLHYQLSEELNAYADNRWNRAVATLKCVYFANLWRGTGTVAAVMLLALTFIQTFYTVKH